MRTVDVWLRVAAALWLGAVLARPAAAQDVAGLVFDVSVVTGDSTDATKQAGRGWIAGNQSRLDLAGPAAVTPTVRDVPGENFSVLVRDSSGTPVITMVMHDTKKFMYPARLMEYYKEMMTLLPEQPRMSISVRNVAVDTLGAGEAVSGFATRRYRVSADILLSLDVLGENTSQSMRVESEGDYAEELSEYADPFRDKRGFGLLASDVPWMDSSAAAEIARLERAAPRGIAVRQVDRVIGVTEGGSPPPTTRTTISNIRPETFSTAVFSIPAGYTEMEMPVDTP